MKNYNFYQSINARRAAITRLIALGSIESILLYVVFAKAPSDFPLFVKIALLVFFGLVSFGFLIQCIPHIKTGGVWKVMLTDQRLTVQFPPSSQQDSFELDVCDIAAIQESRKPRDRSGTNSINRTRYLICTKKGDTHLLPQLQEFLDELFLESLLKTDASIRHTYKNF
jgi:hypothetical protein